MSEILITHEMLTLLAERSSYAVPAGELVFFGFRGLLPLDVTGTEFAASHRTRLTSFDHQRMRCTLGQWRPSQGVLALFPGSTVPNLSAIQTAKAKQGIGANMLMLGRYAYDRGVHKKDKPTGHRAFRQGMFFPVWRNADDLDFDLADRLDTSGRVPDNYPWDNLHCAFHDNVDTPGFSSNGCQVVSGRPSMAANNHRPETGPWARFVTNAYGPQANNQTRFTYLLFSGAEAGLVSARPDGPLPRTVRFGSRGPWVEAVQKGLQKNGFPFLGADGDFGRDTLEAVMGFQAQEFGKGQADGVVGPNTAGALEIDWPPLETGSSRAPSPQPTAQPAQALESTQPVVAAQPSPLPADWLASAVKITPGFEVAGDPYQGVSGDFDGMGISCGALQWNIGKKSLQPMVLAVSKPVVLAAMPTLGADMWRACSSEVQTGLGIVRGWQNATKLTPVARTELRALMGTPQMRAEQNSRIAALGERARKAADAWAASAGRGRATKHEFLWFFDLATQNGSLEGIDFADVQDFIRHNQTSGAANVICNYLAGLTGPSGHIKDAKKNAQLWRTPATPLALELLVLSYLRSGSALPQWRHVVLNRKGCIAAGRGWVNSSEYDLTSHIA
ncbi:peptidoglycan-binding domain-containing protein [Caulobacter endophyticus]|uniref:peptidoglycan-binding domain-containing protein n=1 Tax=Caulobacter endophyticus TaxID=2172652 RepID=UPI00240FDE95|nr:peptidoglycan-binding protein [Caulobacter endophyticus]MDG2529084.1 peptidoglycan-binding domain-containing protein [Caulobacter endophyticus]